MAREGKKTNAGTGMSKFAPEDYGRKKRELTTERIKNFYELVANHNMTVTSAAKVLGVPRSTVYNWLARGKGEPESIHGQFRAAMEVADGEKERGLVENIMRYGDIKEDWKASAWLLEHTYPDRYGNRAFYEVKTDAESMGHLDEQKALENLTDGELRTLLELMRKAGGGGADEGTRTAQPPGFRTIDVPGIQGKLAPSSDS